MENTIQGEAVQNMMVTISYMQRLQEHFNEGKNIHFLIYHDKVS